LGAEVAANADSSIPAWNGGITTAPAGYTPGLHHPDPFSGDSVKFTITGANADQYREMLSTVPPRRSFAWAASAMFASISRSETAKIS
jgi:hypothetical protein